MILLLGLVIAVLVGTTLWSWWGRRKNEPLILQALTDGATYGLVIQDRVTTRGEKLSGSMYVDLRILEDQGLVRAWVVPRPNSPLPLRMYEITEAGIARLSVLQKAGRA